MLEIQGAATVFAELFASGRIVDAILVFMAIEGLVLIAYGRATGRGIAPDAVIVNLLSGGALLLALRATLGGWGLPVIGLCMMVSFGAHLADLKRRWRQ
jgi:hypothetical protein